MCVCVFLKQQRRMPFPSSMSERPWGRWGVVRVCLLCAMVGWIEYDYACVHGDTEKQDKGEMMKQTIDPIDKRKKKELKTGGDVCSYGAGGSYLALSRSRSRARALLQSTCQGRPENPTPRPWSLSVRFRGKAQKVRRRPPF